MEDDLVVGAKLEQPQIKTNPLDVEKFHSKSDFEQFFSNIEAFNERLTACLSGQPRTLKCRFTLWRIFLGLVIHNDDAKTRAEVKKQRDFYTKEKDKFLNLRKQAKEVDDPLSGGSKNPWNAHFEDADLRQILRQDLERTHQESDFFQSKAIQDLLHNILFIWSKQNPEPSYQQGMHEVLALITWVAYAENFKPTNPQGDLYDYINDEKYAEHDIYTVFNKILSLNIKDMYSKNPIPNPKKKKADKLDANGRPNTPVVQRAVYIQEEMLPHFNSNLFDHFKYLKVEPQVYQLRWLKCLLCREFPTLNEGMSIWDAIFSYHYRYPPKVPNLEFIDYMVIAMITYIQQDLLEKDDGGSIMGRLLKYPPVDSVHSIIALAHKARDAITNAGVQHKDQPKLQELEEANTPVNVDKSKDNVILFNKPIQPKTTIKQAYTSGSESSSPSQTTSNNVTSTTSSSGSSNNPFTKKKEDVPILVSNETFSLNKDKMNQPVIKPNPIQQKPVTSSSGGGLFDNPMERKKEARRLIEEKNVQSIGGIQNAIDTLKEEQVSSPNIEQAVQFLNVVLQRLKEQAGEFQYLK